MVHANFHKGGGGHGPPPFPLPTPMRQMKGPLLLKPSEMDSERKTGLENALFKQNEQILNFDGQLTQTQPKSETLSYERKLV